MSKPIALICNDDGIHAQGLNVLAAEIAKICEIYVVAPHLERSGVGHALTISEPLRIEKLPERSYSPHIYSVTGTPADCVLLAVDKLLPQKPRWIFSGINRGANLGTDTLCSGTVGAAMAGAMMGIRSFAISAMGKYGDHFHYETAAKVLSMLFELELSHQVPWGNYTVLNINTPALPMDSIKGIRMASTGWPLHGKSFYENQDPKGRPYYWLGAASSEFADIPESDCNLIDAGFATITALRPNLMDEALQSKFADLLILK